MAEVTVTERAADELRKMAAQASTKDGETIRLVAQLDEGGFAVGPDQVREGDDTVEANGETVLVIASDLAKALEGAVVDVLDTAEGPRLIIGPRSEVGEAV